MGEAKAGKMGLAGFVRLTYVAGLWFVMPLVVLLAFGMPVERAVQVAVAPAVLFVSVFALASWGMGFMLKATAESDETKAALSAVMDENIRLKRMMAGVKPRKGVDDE